MSETAIEWLFGALQFGSTPTDNPNVRSQASEDTALISRLNSGDDTAFDLIFERHWTELWRFARSNVSSNDIAEDIVQDVFARLWFRRRTLHPGTMIRAYLFRTVRNEIINRRKHERVVERSAPFVSLETQDRELPDARSEQDDLVERVDAALDRLPDEQRVALRLRYEHGLRYAEIASVLGISPSAVEKRIARTLGTLRAWILR